jgi:hypothetical protein
MQLSAGYGHLRTHDLHAALEKVAQNRPQDRLTATNAGRDTIVTHWQPERDYGADAQD